MHDKIIQGLKVTFMHDSGEVHQTIYDLTDGGDIEDLASMMQDYYVIGLFILSYKDFNDIEMKEVK